MPRIPRDEVDRLAEEACRDYVAGVRSEASVRVTLSELMFRSPIIVQQVSAFVWFKWSDYWSYHMVIEMTDRVTTFMVDKIQNPGSSRLDLVRIAGGSSFSGWVSNFIAAALPSEMRQYMTAQRQMPLVKENHHDDGDNETSAFDLPTPSASDDYDAIEAELIATDFVDRAGFSNRDDRIHYQARAIREFYHAPELPTVLTQAERDRIATELQREPRAAGRVMGALRRGKESGLDALENLFGDLSMNQLGALCDLPSEVVTFLVQASIAGRPAVPARMRGALKERFSLPCTTPVQKLRAMSVVDAWIAASSTVVSDEQGQPVFKSDEMIAEEASLFAGQATLLLRLGYPAADVSAIADALTDMSDAIAIEQNVTYTPTVLGREITSQEPSAPASAYAQDHGIPIAELLPLVTSDPIPSGKVAQRHMAARPFPLADLDKAAEEWSTESSRTVA